MTKIGLVYYWNDNAVLRNETNRNKTKQKKKANLQFIMILKNIYPFPFMLIRK